MIPARKSALKPNTYTCYFFLKVIGRVWIVLILLQTEVLLGQVPRNKIDSVKERQTTPNDRLKKIDLLLDLMREQMAVDIDEAYRLSKSAVYLSEQSRDSLRIVKSYFAQGYILRKQNRLPESIALYKRAMFIGERNKLFSELTRIYNSLGIAHTFAGHYDSALSIHFKSLEFNEKYGTKEDESITLNNIGFVHFKLSNHQEAKSFYLRSLEIKDSIKNTFDADRLLINIALCENQLKHYKEAESYITRGLSICGTKCDPIIRLEAEMGLGLSFFERGDDAKASLHFREAYNISKNVNENRFTAESLINLAKISTRQRRQIEALSFLDEAEAVATASQYPELQIDIYKNKSLIYNQINDHRNAADYQSRYIRLKDSIYSNELINNLADVQAQYQERKNLKTIREQSEILLLKEEIIKRQRQQTTFITIVACIGILLAYVFFRLLREIQRKKADLAEKNRQLREAQEALRKITLDLDHLVAARTRDLAEINRSLTRTNEELDHFIYRTSHDIRGPLASLLGLAYLGKLEVTEPVAGNYLRQIDQTASKLNGVLSKLAKINQISRGILKPESIDLPALIQRIVTRQIAAVPPGTVDISIEVDDTVRLISDSSLLETCLENLISNAIKYRAEGLRSHPFVKIVVYKKMHAALIRVIDNGIGIPSMPQERLFRMFVRASERSETGGIGLYLAKLSATRIFGKLSYSKDEAGHTVFLLLLHPNLEQRVNQSEQEKTKKRVQEASVRARVRALSNEVL